MHACGTALVITFRHSQHRSCWFGNVPADVGRTLAGGISDEHWPNTAVVRSIRRLAHDQRWLRPGVTLNRRVCSRKSVQDCHRVRPVYERRCSYCCLTSFHDACYTRGNTCVSYAIQYRRRLPRIHAGPERHHCTYRHSTNYCLLLKLF